MSTTIPVVNTAKVTNRRPIRYHFLDDLLKDASALAAADQAGKLQHMGNWTLGQAFGHLAGWINFGYDGFPLRAPWIIRVVGKALKGRFLKKGMSPGQKIAKTPSGTFATEVLPTDEGLSRLQKAIERLRESEPPFPSPALVQLNHKEAIDLNLRHAELHLSFFRAE